ncbi:MAG: signal recognition particle-docking protein FtsY [Candidatus Hinthialibacter antarcticus]|nr:signal recognition particle-docking protein FtsY [Candidatus Hinthialibacter antarcticus]
MFWKRKEKQDPIEPLAESPIEAPVEVQEAKIEVPATETIETAEAIEEDPASSAPRKGLFAKLRDRLRKTRESIVTQAVKIFRLHGKIDDDLLEELEEVLILADVGVNTTMELMGELRNRIRVEKKKESDDLNWLTRTLQELSREMLEQGDRTMKTAASGPSVYLVIGVNGVGKTTAIGKLASRFKAEGKSVLLVAADTFRAAAIEQLAIWSKRADVPIVMGKEGADPSSVVYQAMERLKTETADIVIIDTAGRLHTKSNLMQELAKMARVISREVPEAPHETLLVLDASTGQNALSQAKTFTEACQISGLVLTKLDGTAKGGVILSVHKQLKLPVKWIGVGEGIDDLEPFDPDAFTKALFNIETEPVEESEAETTEA